MNSVPEPVHAIAPEFEAAVAVVAAYLQALEARDVDKAQAFLAADFHSIGPGGRTASSVAGMVANSAKRYRRIGKHFERFDALPAPGGNTIVYCMGTLHGEWLEEGSFSGIRFIDRFELKDGLITTQEVWNDTAEHRLRGASAQRSRT